MPARIFLTGEGSEEKRGLRPLSNSLPPLKQNFFLAQMIKLFERGIKGVSKRFVPSLLKVMRL
jgi:hypothetical protein